MKKLYLAFYSICIFLAACTGNEIENNEEYLPQSKEALSPVGEESLMLYFNSTADFFQTFHQLLIEDENAQLKWVSNKNLKHFYLILNYVLTVQCCQCQRLFKLYLTKISK
jgi:hypothetical protein